MTKAQEIKHLNKIILDFGPDSYLGPWLAEYEWQLVQDITSDREPGAILPSTAYREAQQIFADARITAADIIAKATMQAEDLTDRTAARVKDYRTAAREALVRIANTL